jgi:hypothetical protein
MRAVTMLARDDAALWTSWRVDDARGTSWRCDELAL